ncbi:MAG TPA: bifunctional phosphopantothenoylcysteine decarboxylase/phosphopantothenate--cysteine ligase CoaBC [Candidatus Micrarchaeaceae archaeon]|nr:bifunctional phosphopantothenoylcysteine decarboxylase/phosphopantothenate--cysteine ligase CoaBC [Candidatus Micrarchaeaceae archaeon]
MADAIGQDLAGRHIAVHVCGGVAVVKVPELITSLRRRGAEVRVAMTSSATSFISPTTLRALSGNPVVWRLFPAKAGSQADDDQTGHGMAHIDLSSWAECHLVVPATASTLARLATGLADDVVSSSLLATAAPIVLAPAMETGMWRHPATQQNLATLVARGALVVGPVSGRLASGRKGEGRLAEPEEILAVATRLFQEAGPMRGWEVLVTAGGTREPIDPVRYLGNRSSGRMGQQLAVEAAARGATVHLVTAAEAVPRLPGVEALQVETADEMLRACLELLPSVRLVLMAAAVADFRVEHPALSKLHRREHPELELRLVPNVDILTQLTARRRPGCLVVGFAAETEQVVARGRAKLEQKGCDMIVANSVSGEHSAMGGEMAAATLLIRGGRTVELAWQPKSGIAGAVLDEAVRMDQESSTDPPLA